MKEPTVFGRQLRKAREKAGISQRRLGIDVGFDEFSASPRMNQYERGTHTPDFETAKRLATCLNVPVEYLYSEDELMADLILEIGALTPEKQQELLRSLKERQE